MTPRRCFLRRRVLLEGKPSLGGGQLYRDPVSGRFRLETSPGLDDDTVRQLDDGDDTGER